ncbi:MAG: VWA domain-containing protein [Magnetococcales bacterium]|nr:VWA domain-containing protein [Magnetococcales bacterium]
MAVPSGKAATVTEWHFLRPEWLLALGPLLLLVWRLAKSTLAESSWSRVCDPHLLPHILHQSRQGAAQWAPWWVGVVGSLLIVAMAGPVWHRLPQPVFRTQSALVVLLDLSRSMDATDLKPSRLVRAKHKIIDLLRKNRAGQTGLLVFAGNAFVVTPLTHDTGTITAQLSSLETALMPLQGSRPDRAIEKALDLLRQGGIAHGDILLLTDEWAGEEWMASRVAKEGHRLTILGVGTPEGAPVPLVDGGFLEDANGAILMAKLDEQSLKRLARLGGGGYQSIQTDDQDIDALLQRETAADLNNAVNKMELMADVWREEGPWLVLLLLPLLALTFRRGIFIWLGLLLSMPGEGHAIDWESLWSRPDQRAMRQFEAGKWQESASQFTDPAWKGTAYYRAGAYEKALAEWQGSHSTEALYNAGTALAKMGRLQESAQAYLEVLKQQPDHQDAKHNLEAIQQAMNPAAKQEEKAGSSDQQKQSAQQSSPSSAKPQDGGDKQENKAAQTGEKDSATQGQDGKQRQAEKNKEAAQQAENAQSKAMKEAVQKQEESQSVQSDVSETADGQRRPAGEEQSLDKETKVAMEQWLRRVPDDPGGLLRRKFRYQYQREGGQIQTEEGMRPW